MAVYIDTISDYNAKERTQFSRLRFQIFAGSLLFAALAFRVWVRIGTIDLGYKLASLRSEAVELDLQRRELELQYSVLARPDRLFDLAQQKFGMRSARTEEIVRIK